MLKILCYIEDRGTFEFISVSDSGRLATRVHNPFAAVPEIQDLERLLKAKLDEADPKPDGLEELLEEIHKYNEVRSPYERVRYIKTLTPQLVRKIEFASMTCDARFAQYAEQCRNTIIEMKLEEIHKNAD